MKERSEASPASGGTRRVETGASKRHGTRRRLAGLFVCVCLRCTAAYAETDVEGAVSRDNAAFSFAVVASASTPDGAPETASLLRAIGDSDARFVVQFDASSSSCSDGVLERRRALLDASPKPLIPLPATTEWADCGTAGGDPFERLQRVDDAFFAGDQSLGQERLPWFRQSATPRFHRYRENLRWQVGRVLFATVNLPDNNNDFRIGAGRNGEFEERLVANRAWLQRTFRLASERKLLGVVLFIEAGPRFAPPWRVPDLRSPDRDGYYEWKVELRELVSAFNGKVLLVQGHGVVEHGTGSASEAGVTIDHPLHEPGGRTLTNLSRVVALRPDGEARWLRVAIDPGHPALFRIESQRVFDDPSGELYGPARVK